MAVLEFYPGSGSVFSSITLQGANGETMVWDTSSQLLADVSVTPNTTNLALAGWEILALVARVITNVTTNLGTNTFSLGDALAPSRWGLNIAGAAGTTVGQGDWTQAPGSWDNAAQDAILTPPGAEVFTGGSVRIVAYIRRVTPPTS